MKNKLVRIELKRGVNNYPVNIGAPRQLVECKNGAVIMLVDPSEKPEPCTITLAKVGDTVEGSYLGKCGELYAFSTCFA